MVVSRLAWSADGLVLAVGLAPRSPDADGSTSGTAAFAISESVRLYTSDGLPLSAVEDEGRSMSSPSTYVSLAPRANNSLLHVSQHTLCPSCPVLDVFPRRFTAIQAAPRRQRARRGRARWHPCPLRTTVPCERVGRRVGIGACALATADLESGRN